MAEQTARDVVNDLIETCRDGARGFANAASLVSDEKLEALLRQLAEQRAAFANELEPHAQRLGGAAAATGTAAAALHRGWMDVKSLLTSHDDRAVLAEVRRGDAVTLRMFADAVAGLLPPSVRDVIEAQERRIRDDHTRIDEVLQAARAHTGP